MKRCSTRSALWRWVTLGGTFVLCCVGQTTAPAPAITVRVDTVGPASERDVIEFERSATQIFRHAGIEAIWLNCWSAHAQCGTFVQQDELGQAFVRLRIVDRLDRGGVHTLGWMTQGSSAVTVQYRRAQQIACTTTIGLSPGQVLGHVGAHEIGHVLLGSNAHGSFGVMKASYSKEDLRDMVQGRLLFTPEESRVLHARLGYK